MSIHTTRAYHLAKGKGASSARNFETWTALTSMSKRELAEIAMHLAAMCTDSYDDALSGGGNETALARVMEERGALKQNGLI